MTGEASDDPATIDPADRAASTRDGGARRGDFSAELPRRLGRYHVLERIGAGGMSVVFAAYDPELDRKIAVKLLRPDYDRDSQVRLLREAQALARLSHPNVVQIHDAGSVGQRVFLAMEFIRGLDLRAWLAAAPRGRAELLRVFVEAGRGLAAAHDHGLVHRDFKPENVLVGADGRVRVVDFGLVRAGTDGDPDAAPRGHAPGGALTLDMTTTGTTLGTPAYMSPEQHLGAPTDPRTDQFSFCVALWEALCGQRPFAADGVAATARAVIAGRLSPPPADARLSRHLLELLRRGLQARPERRFPDMHALLQRLARDPARARRRWLAGAAAASVVLGGTWLVAERSVREADACSGGALTLAPDWDPARREALSEALRAQADPSLRERVLAGLDARAAAWLAGHREACEDQRRGEQSSALFDARVRCLGRRRQALGRAVDILLTPGAARDPLLLVARLPSVRACADAAGAEADATDDPALALASAELETRLIAARTLHHAGDAQRARAAVEAVIAAARDGELRALLAESLLLLGDISTTLGDVARGREVLGEAALHALASGRDGVAAEALARQLFLDGLLGESARALAGAPLARAIAERLPAPGPALARLDNNLGTLAHNAGDVRGAQQYFERATTELRRTPDADPLKLANYWTNLGINADEVATRDLAFTEATTLLVRELGEDHLQTLALRLRHAIYEPDLERGAALLTAACPRYLARHPRGGSSCGACFHRLGLLSVELGRDDDARAALRRVPECLRALANDPDVDEHFAGLRGRSAAALALLERRPAEADALATAALRSAEPGAALWWVALEVAESQLVRGAALLALGRPAAAHEAFTRARDLITDVGRTHHDALLPRWSAAAEAGIAAAR